MMLYGFACSAPAGGEGVLLSNLLRGGSVTLGRNRSSVLASREPWPARGPIER